MPLPRLIVFDLDGTLTVSKAPLDERVGALLVQLLERIPLAVTSGASLSQFLEQFISRLGTEAQLERLYLLPTSGAALYEYAQNDWRCVYAEKLSEEEMRSAEDAIVEAVSEAGMTLPEAYGSRTERREDTQVSFSALGQQAPVAHKQAWDPDQRKRRSLVGPLQSRLPWAEIRIGGMTTIDITKRGIDKRYGIERLSQRLSIPVHEMLYVGDALYEGGNDAVVIPSGIQIKSVSGPEETALFLRSLLAEKSD